MLTVDPDQTPRSEASNLCLQSLPRSFLLDVRVTSEPIMLPHLKFNVLLERVDLNVLICNVLKCFFF